VTRWCWLLVLVAGCTLPGEPRGLSLVGQPAKVEDFDALYRTNCAGCHGDDGRGGATLGLANPIYLAIADDATLRRATGAGVPGTAMPAFGQSAGGMLTAGQIEALVHGMRARWSNASALAGKTPPPYAGPPGNPAEGKDVYAQACASCHGGDGSGGAGSGSAKGHSIVDGSYLALVSPQGLRTLLIAGRPDLGHPDWRAVVPGRALSSQEIADVVAWLKQQQPEYPGQPYTSSR
jgi:cytochrome c oxidase cbb3-type subunit 3/ubiquinol-cytochrome c reductase cytochrome c subunit